MNDIILKLENHKRWIDSLGKLGEKLNLDECDLRELDYSKYSFKQGSITDCKFDESELNNIDFYAATLCSSSFKNSILKEVDFHKGELSYTDFYKAFIRCCRFSKCDISEADFRYCKIEDSNLVNTILYMTDFSYAELSNVDVSRASFDETIVREIKLKNIIGLEEVQIESINIGTYEEPQLLYGEEAKAWFQDIIKG